MFAYCLLHELHIIPSAFYALPRSERAFIVAAFKVRKEAEDKRQKELEAKAKKKP